MKKILIFIFLTVLTPVFANPSVLPSRQIGSITKQAPDRPNPLVRTQQSNMILNVQQGIAADQKDLNSRYFNNGPGIKQRPNVRYNYPPRPGMNPNAYGPAYVPRTNAGYNIPRGH